MDLNLSVEDLTLQKISRDFAKKEILPIAAKRDVLSIPGKAYPWEILKKLDALGIRTLTVPKKYGGYGANHLQQAIVSEELAYGDLGVAVSLDQNFKFTQLICNETTEDQRDRYLHDFLTDPTALLAIAITEPQSGTDSFLLYEAPIAGPRMTAKKDGKDYVLNGTKHYISNGGLAKYYFIFARTDPSKPMSEGLTGFIVPKDTPGFSIGEAHSKLGRRLLQNGELVLSDCRVPETNILGEWNKGLDIFRKMVSGALIPVMGPARLSYDLARKVLKESPIINDQWAQMLLSEMYMLIEAGRTFLYSAAWHGGKESDESKRRLMSKVFASEAAIKVCRSAMEIWEHKGDLHFTNQPTPEKCWRDVLSYLHGFGTNQAVKLKCFPMISLDEEEHW